MKGKTLSKSGSELFQSYLKKHKDVVKDKAAQNYYPVNVVADAFTEGFTAGEKSGKEAGREEIIDKLVRSQFEEITQKATQVHILTYRVIDHIVKNGFSVNSFYMDIFHQNPKVILVVDNDCLLNDHFVKTTYQKIFEVKRIFDDLFKVDLDMGVTGSFELDPILLHNDGYQYSEQIK